MVKFVVHYSLIGSCRYLWEDNEVLALSQREGKFHDIYNIVVACALARTPRRSRGTFRHRHTYRTVTTSTTGTYSPSPSFVHDTTTPVLIFFYVYSFEGTLHNLQNITLP